MSRKEEKVSLSDFENIYNSNIYMYTNVLIFCLYLCSTYFSYKSEDNVKVLLLLQGSRNYL